MEEKVCFSGLGPGKSCLGDCAALRHVLLLAPVALKSFPDFSTAYESSPPMNDQWLPGCLEPGKVTAERLAPFLSPPSSAQPGIGSLGRQEIRDA